MFSRFFVFVFFAIYSCGTDVNYDINLNYSEKDSFLDVHIESDNKITTHLNGEVVVLEYGKESK